MHDDLGDRFRPCTSCKTYGEWENTEDFANVFLELLCIHRASFYFGLRSFPPSNLFSAST